MRFLPVRINSWIVGGITLLATGVALILAQSGIPAINFVLIFVGFPILILLWLLYEILSTREEWKRFNQSIKINPATKDHKTSSRPKRHI